ncbi:S-adenosyl-L-methionine:benzoic acid/salicylic acid carboxyl methyltransferase 3-like [Rutidosis leptorrhynchoides]|uniref:S-adenosyl-L-methionine:benzoic acid/salicylic acid carboxyl methyltransferase 3-like n=1 Tax=Rutidosis leptorrhynchoides TaxID=125765 RepID=UPI003A99544C
MKLENILHMNIGDGELGYANNSVLQEIVIRKVQPILKLAIIKCIANYHNVFGHCFKIVDMGCLSSKNTLLVASTIIHTVSDACEAYNLKTPQFQVSLNDLFGNDFNQLFQLLPEFYAKLKKEKREKDWFGHCFVSAVPGSFYGRLFPDRSLHFVHSSYSLHWLSQVPKGLESNGLNIYLAKTSPPNVLQAYAKQFQIDFMNFLQMRYEEIVRGGCMVLTFISRSIVDATRDDCCSIMELLAQSLIDMAKMGLVQESYIHSFNMPIYFPFKDEVKNIVQNEGSFSLDKLATFQVNWDPLDADYANANDFNESHGENAAKVVRAVVEPLLSSHFGEFIIEELFKMYEKHVVDHLANQKTRYCNLVISLTKN